MKILDFPLFRQTKNFDCGAIALQMVLAYFDINVRGDIIIKEVKSNKSGTKIENILKTIKKNKLKYQAEKMSLEILKKHLKNNHPVIIPLQAWTAKRRLAGKIIGPMATM